jgi:hypothetical protein
MSLVPSIPEKMLVQALVARSRPLKLSANAFCIGLSCAIQCQVTPVPAEDGHRYQFCQSARDLDDPALLHRGPFGW